MLLVSNKNMGLCLCISCEVIKSHLDTSPKSELALDLHCRAAQSVEAHHRVSRPNTGRNSGGRQIKKKYLHFLHH